MDAFEQLAAEFFWNQGFWVRNCVKVELTREDKALIGRHSSPRWEIDLVAYDQKSNELLALECKSYLDSGGVHAAHFAAGSRYATRYKLFHDDVLRETVLNRLRQQFVDQGFCPENVQVKLGLIHAHVTAYNAPVLADIFAKGGWLLFGPDWIGSQLQLMAGGGYENSTAAVVAKLLLRSPTTKNHISPSIPNSSNGALS